MSEYTKKIVEELFRINEERKAELANMEFDIDEILEEIFAPKVEEKELFHIFICMNNDVAKEVNVLPETVAKTLDNLVIIKRLDSFTENKEEVRIEVDGVSYLIPRKYSYSFAFVK